MYNIKSNSVKLTLINIQETYGIGFLASRERGWGECNNSIVPAICTHLCSPLLYLHNCTILGPRKFRGVRGYLFDDSTFE
jgi:hypothetical protein